MANELNMNGLTLKDSQHAPPPGQSHEQNGFAGERSAYIPPHMRSSARGPAPAGFDGGAGEPPMGNGSNGTAWAPPPK